MAMLVKLSMHITLVAACLAYGETCLEKRLGDLDVVFGQTADDPGSGGAEVSAILAEPNTLDHLAYVWDA
jgi:hypothetical protein